MEHSQNYPSDMPRQDATSRDIARQVATDDDYISIKEARAIFIERGRSASERTLQRYCDKNQLDARKILTGEGEKWFVLRSSVYHRLAELEQFELLHASRQDATRRDMSTIVAEQNAASFSDDMQRHATGPDIAQASVAEVISHATQHDTSRQDATGRDMSRHTDETVEHKNTAGMSDRERELYEQLLATYKDRIEDLVQDKGMLQDDKRMLVEQLLSKDKQIDNFFSSDRDTKKLFGNIQSFISYIWPGSKRSEPNGELPQTFTPVVRDLPDRFDETQEGRDR